MKNMIVTHSGKFHADDVFACYILSLLFPSCKIVRSRDPSVIRNAKFVVDVGGVYNHETHRYDHHQPNFNVQIGNSGVLLSACGLVFKHYGSRLIRKIIGGIIPDSLIIKLRAKMYHNFVKEIDAIDNGERPPDYENFQINTDVSSMIRSMNNFGDAMRYIKVVFETKLFIEYDKLTATGGDTVIDCDKFTGINQNVIVFDKFYPTWKKGIFKYINEHDLEYLLIIYPEIDGYKILSFSNSNFSTRLLPSQDTLESKMKQYSDLIFIHTKRFVAVTKTLEAALDIINITV